MQMMGLQARGKRIVNENLRREYILSNSTIYYLG